MPNTAPEIKHSRVLFWDLEAADSSVCGSSNSTKSGRTISPVVNVCTLPRMPSPVKPLTPMMNTYREWA